MHTAHTYKHHKITERSFYKQEKSFEFNLDANNMVEVQHVN